MAALLEQRSRPGILAEADAARPRTVLRFDKPSVGARMKCAFFRAIDAQYAQALADDASKRLGRAASGAVTTVAETVQDAELCV